MRDGGLGWRGVFAVAAGFQYEVSDRVTVRGGYLYNTNPIPAPVTVFNIQAPGITQHTLSLGASVAVTEDVNFSAGWVHGFRNAIDGSIIEIPGSSARLDVQTDSIVAGITVRFGARRKPAEKPAGGSTAPAPATD